MHWLCGAVIVTAIAGVWLFKYSRRFDAKLESALPLDVRFIPRSELGTKRIIDFTLFGKNIQYPRTLVKLQDGESIEGLSGFLALHEQMDFRLPEDWIDEWGNVHRISAAEKRFTASNPDGITLPFVYGNKAKRIRLNWTSAPVGREEFDSRSAIFELPANGTPAPKPKSVRVRVGAWAVRFDALPYFAPGMEAEYDVSVESNGPEKHFFIDITGTDSHHYISYQKGVPTRTPISEWSRTIKVVWVKKTTASLKIQRKWIAADKYWAWHFVDQKSRVLATMPEPANRVGTGNDYIDLSLEYSRKLGALKPIRDMEGLQVLGRWVDGARDASPGFEQKTASTTFREGDVIDAVIWLKAGEAHVPLNMR